MEFRLGMDGSRHVQHVPLDTESILSASELDPMLAVVYSLPIPFFILACYVEFT
jgi:hypothetical protein